MTGFAPGDAARIGMPMLVVAVVVIVLMIVIIICAGLMVSMVMA